MFAEIAVADIVPNPHQPRVHFDEESLAELAASIARDRCAAADPRPPESTMGRTS